MDKIKWKGGALIAPLPAVMVSCSDGERDNIITVAWTGIINTIPPKTYISVRPKRFSYGLISSSREFTINLTTVALARATDYCGMYTGRKVDKFEKCSLTRQSGSENSCPMIAESPLSLECKVTDEIPLGTHNMLLADIVAVNADESLLDKSGKLDMGRAQLIAFAHGAYYELGKQLGTFGYSVEKKSTQKRKKALNGSKDKRRQR